MINIDRLPSGSYLLSRLGERNTHNFLFIEEEELNELYMVIWAQLEAIKDKEKDNGIT